VELVGLRATAFRNLKATAVSFGPGTNILLGANGQGKTNLLEAVTVLGNLRSFRESSMARVVAHGEAGFSLDGVVATTGGRVSLGQEVSAGPPIQRRLTVAGRPASVAQYLQVFPVFTLSGADRELVVGPPAARRAFVDRCVFLTEPPYFDDLRRYRRSLSQRNAALSAMVPDNEMDAWESRLAATAAAVVDRRHRMVRRLADSFQTVYSELRGGDFPELGLAYRGESTQDEAAKVTEVEEYYRKRYNETRDRDRRLGFTGEGPHRHDLVLKADGRTVRHVLSSGQTKMVAAALRLASLTQVEKERGERFAVIIDDVDAELDKEALSRLVHHLEGTRQLFLSSADSAVLEGMTSVSSRLELRRGEIAGQAGERIDE
jgi:DNA replication and repair protein RecF